MCCMFNLMARKWVGQFVGNQKLINYGLTKFVSSMPGIVIQGTISCIGAEERFFPDSRVCLASASSVSRELNSLLSMKAASTHMNNSSSHDFQNMMFQMDHLHSPCLQANQGRLPLGSLTFSW